MRNFTEYHSLFAFARQADGDFSYLWYDVRMTERIWLQDNGKRVYFCTNAKEYL